MGHFTINLPENKTGEVKSGTSTKASLSLFRKLVAEYKPDAVFCQLIRTAEYARGLQLPKTLDYMDVFSKGIERRIN